MTAKKLNCCQAHWSLYFAHFDFTLYHWPRWSMEKPNALSQRPDHGKRSSNNENMVLLCLEFLAVYALEKVELIGAEQNILSKIYKGNHSRDLKELVIKTTQEL